MNFIKNSCGFSINILYENGTHMSLPLKNLRIVPRDSEFLNRKTGEFGEIFYDKDANTLRLYQGLIGGTALARGDLVNVSNSDFLAKANSAGVSGGGGNTTVSVGSSVPVSPSSGNLWLNTNTGSLYVYINDGTSSQWIQPSVPFPNLTEYATQQYVTSSVVQAIAAIPPFEFFTAADDSTQRLITNGNTVKFIGAGGVTTSSNADGTITITGSQPIPTPPFEFFTAADDSTQRLITNGNTVKFIGAGGVTTSSNADGYITITGGGSTGNVTFVATTIDSSDSSAIIFTPAVIFNSDITVQNELFVDNNINVTRNLTTNNLIVSGEISSQGSGTPELFSDNEIQLTAGTRVEITASPIKLASFTSAARDLLTASNGDMIYNTTTNKFQGRASGAWVDLH
jgi:hypothetical protein